MIPATHILVDGDTALYVLTNDVLRTGNMDLLNRQCDNCGGDGLERWQTAVDEFDSDRCPDCDGTGRHTFEMRAEQVDRWDGDAITSYRSLRVHVIDVLPIIYPKSCRSKAPDRCVEMAPGWDNMLWLSAEQEHALPITLPPAAAPGMWLVRLAVHQ